MIEDLLEGEDEPGGLFMGVILALTLEAAAFLIALAFLRVMGGL